MTAGIWEGNRGASRDHSALFHVMLAFDKEQSASSPLANAEIPPISVGLGAVPCDLILRARLHDGVIRAELESRSDTFDSSTIERMARHYLTLLSNVADAPDRSITELPIMPPEERQQVLFTWNATQASYPPDTCIHHLFEEQARAYPTRIAVTSEEGAFIGPTFYPRWKGDRGQADSDSGQV